ncbi:MAG: hypothetical protein ACREDE_09780, partial [Thermoplasmata archaeon]
MFACAWVGAEVTGHSSEFVPGLLVNITFWDGAQTVVPGGAPPATLTTTGTSPVAFSFIPTAPPFSSYYAYPFGNSFNLTATDPAATTLGYPGAYENYSFEVIPSGASGAVQVTLNAFDYAVGATVSATWTLGSSNASETGALTATQWALVTSRGFAATGPIASTSSSGVLSIPLPAGYVGEFAVAVVASNGSGAFIGAGTGEAEQPSLLLGSPLGGWYVPGQALSFPVEIAPNALPDTTIYYNVTGEWYSFALGTVVSEGIVAVGTVGSSGAVQFTVATESPATYYFVDVWAQSPTSGVYASASAEVRLATGFQVLLGVTTASSYSDGSFQPGQSIQVSWALSSLGGVPLPGAYMIVLELASTTVLTSWSTTASSGAVSVTIPSNA